MNKSLFIKYSPIVLMMLVLTACGGSQPVIDLKIDVAYFSKAQLCASSTLPANARALFRPYQMKDSIAEFSGKIMQLGSDPLKQYITISDSNYGWMVRMRKGMFGKKDTYASTTNNYDNMIADVNSSALCGGGKDVKPEVANANFDKIKNGYDGNIVVLSKRIKEAAWQNYKVYHDADSLKSYITSLLAGKGAGASKALVLVDPPDSTSGGPGNIPPSKPEFAKLTELLTQTSNFAVPFEQRTADIKTAMAVYFTNDFSVVMHADAATANQQVWDIGHGQKYLQRLTINQAINGFYIISAYKNQADNKISRIELVEYHKQ